MARDARWGRGQRVREWGAKPLTPPPAGENPPRRDARVALVPARELARRVDVADVAAYEPADLGARHHLPRRVQRPRGELHLATDGDFAARRLQVDSGDWGLRSGCTGGLLQHD